LVAATVTSLPNDAAGYHLVVAQFMAARRQKAWTEQQRIYHLIIHLAVTPLLQRSGLGVFRFISHSFF
jgi:hypothetical protein